MPISGVIEKITQKLQEHKIAFVEYGEVLPDPPSEIIDQGAFLCKESEARS